MTILKDSGFERALPTAVKDAHVWLIHGTDDGLISERAQAIAKAFHALSPEAGDTLRIDDKELADDPDRLTVELRTRPMFGGPNVVRLRAGARLTPNLIEPMLEPNALLGLLVVEAGNLKKDSKVRKLVEGAANAVAIACYPDDNRSLDAMIDTVFTASRISADRDTRVYLVDRLGADRGLSRAEVDKLALYLGDGATATIEDVDAIVGDAVEQAMDRVVYAAFNGKPTDAISEWDRALAAGQAPQGIIIALLRHATMLHRLHIAATSGKTLEQAVRSARPPVHFKRQSEVMAQLRRWPLSDVEAVVLRIQQVTRMVRRHGTLETPGIGAVILSIASHKQVSGGR